MDGESEEPYPGCARWLSIDYPDGRSVFYRLNDHGNLLLDDHGSPIVDHEDFRDTQCAASVFG
jgi:hypothetical protein